MSYLTPKQVAERLQVTRETVYHLLTRGEIPSVLVTPRARRVAESDLDAFLASRRVAS